MSRYNKVEFYQKEYANTPYKEYVYKFICKGYCVVKGLQGREFWAASQVNLQDTLKLQNLRYDKRIFDASIVKYNDKFYDIVQFDSPQHNKSCIELKIREVVDVGEI